ncbi:hypothetical protein FZC79_15020 [Rossellomorea vietnamensis]|uniref:Uncharacterized protein n=2 Tax=Rossellomorea TaxID=2837508 RepID=A0A5D4KB30_9BACI|nr:MULTISPECIES: hypothetical protein [Rossellomorea]TYR74392.1 hypothetical protein FZC79_15020 [Rossellomorea vietnamensis]TYS75269.1 hypothetical protein FZC80_17675 [Rossellomorea aquimaris]
MKIQELINTVNYWDSTLLTLDINYFADELTLKCEEGSFLFVGCNNLNIENYHVSSEEEISPKHWEYGKSPYSLQDIKVVELNKDTKNKYQGIYQVNILMDLMLIKLTCNKITVKDEKITL